jgi:hypothetical protein
MMPVSKNGTQSGWKNGVLTFNKHAVKQDQPYTFLPFPYHNRPSPNGRQVMLSSIDPSESAMVLRVRDWSASRIAPGANVIAFSFRPISANSPVHLPGRIK